RRFFQGGFGLHLRSFVTTTKPKSSLNHNLKSVPLALTADTVGFGQRLMERWAPLRLRDGHTLGGAQANVRYGVTGGAAVGRGPLKRRVARKAIALQPRMRRDQVARADHFMWPGEAEVDDYRQYQRTPDPD
ncbi:hypothetical protein, partial [Sphingopyxis sp. NFH-91]|uniref:hypothetical protein n=1 Tax=Sphingopyxis sp. NFH-91 TaxID=2744457 RepID=UPI001F2C9822